MPAFGEIGRIKLLAELFALAMKMDPNITVAKNNTALQCLMDFGLTEHQAEVFLDQAFTKMTRGLMRSPDQLLDEITISFRKREHSFVLGQIQAILEAGEITEPIQQFYDLCCNYLYHEG